MAHLVQQHGLDPKSICAVTFTKKAAFEMQLRLNKLIGEEKSSKLIMGAQKSSPELACVAYCMQGTFHALCNRFLRKWGRILGIKSTFTVLDADARYASMLFGLSRTINMHVNSQKVLTKIVKEHEEKINKLSSSEQFGEANVKAFIFKTKAVGLGPEDIAIEHARTHPSEGAKLTLIIFEAYQKKLKDSNCLDFDDLLYFGVKLFQRRPVCAHWCEHILVDEL